MKVYLYRKAILDSYKSDTEVWSTYDGNIDFWPYEPNITKIPLNVFEAKQIQEAHSKRIYKNILVEPVEE